jgi:hypothetical protein
MRPTVPQVLPLVQELYTRNAVGCCLHIVLDDYNISDSNVDFCYAEAVKAQHADCMALSLLLKQMSKTQRKKLCSVDAKRHHNPRS